MGYTHLPAPIPFYPSKTPKANRTGLLYNLYADALLSLSLVPSEIYVQQSDFYPSVANTYGVPLDTRHTYTKIDWELWAAAISSPDTQDMFISRIAKWVQNTPTNRPCTDLYDTDSGDAPSGGPYFMARPVLGGAFAGLALDKTVGGDAKKWRGSRY